MANVPYPPFDDRPIDPYSKIGCGVSWGTCYPKGISFDHSMYGTLAGTDAWFRKRDICSLTPWGIGGPADGALDGKIYRWMDYGKFKDVVPWSSGPWRPPGIGDGPAYVALHGVGGINGFGEAIETSDGGSRQLPMSPKQWKSLIWLKAAIAHHRGVASEKVRDILAFMHHREICFHSGKDCPFPRIYDYTEEYIGATLELMRYFEGKANDLNALVFRVAGLSIDFRDVARMRDGLVPKPEPTVPTGPIFHDFTPNREFTVGAGGATVRQWASRESKILLTLPAGRKFLADGYYFGEKVNNDNRWLVLNNDPRGRIHLSGVLERVA